MLGYERISFSGALGQTCQVGIGRTIDPIRIWKRFRKVRSGEGEEFFVRLSVGIRHPHSALPLEISPRTEGQPIPNDADRHPPQLYLRADLEFVLRQLPSGSMRLAIAPPASGALHT